MEFLASKKIVHRDLAARNILLSDSNQAKISDFGLAFFNSDSSEKSIPKKLPIRWLSLEALTNKNFSEKSDVWAFAIMIFEIFSLGQVPYPDLSQADVITYLRNGKRMERPGLASEAIYEIMLKCWEMDTESRPNFEELAVMLGNMIENETGYGKYYERLVDEN